MPVEHAGSWHSLCRWRDPISTLTCIKPTLSTALKTRLDSVIH